MPNNQNLQSVCVEKVNPVRGHVVANFLVQRTTAKYLLFRVSSHRILQGKSIE